MTDPTTLESMLLEMAHYGKPRLGLLSGWHACIDMTVNATGAKFEIRSEFNHPTPTAATAECLQRMRDVMRGVASNVAQLDHTP
ncbi:MAG: hypothetical protein ABI114_00465 [Rhodanobacter sp.]